MEASAEDRKPIVLFHGLKIFGSVLKAKSRDKLCRPKSSPPKGPIETTLKEKTTTTSLNHQTKDTSEISVKNNSRSYGIKDEDTSNFSKKKEPSDCSDNVNRYDGDVPVVDTPRLPDNDHIAESKCSLTREKLDNCSLNNTISDHSISKESGYSLKDNQKNSIVTRFSPHSLKSYVNKKNQCTSFIKKVILYDHVAITNKSHKARLKRVPRDSRDDDDDDDETTVLRNDFPVTVKQFNWSEKRKSQINVESSSPGRYTSKPYSPTGFNLYDEKTNSCVVNSGNSLRCSCSQDDPMLFCDINDSKLSLCNALNEEYCHIKFKENLKNIGQVSVKEEPCDINLKDEGNDSGIHSPMRSDLLSNVSPKIDGKDAIKEEPCDNTIDDDENDSGIHSPMQSDLLSNVKPMINSKVSFKAELCDQLIEVDDGNDSGIHSPMRSDLLSNVTPMIHSKVSFKAELCDQRVKVDDGNDSGIHRPMRSDLLSNVTPMINSKVSVKEELCDQLIEVDDGNDSGIRSPKQSDLLGNVTPMINIKVSVKEEPCDSLIKVDDGNDSGIRSPMRSDLSSIATQKVETYESAIKMELDETDQNILIDEPWLPWLPLNTRENEKLKDASDEADLLKQIKTDLEPKIVSKKKLANKYISKYQKPQLNESGQTFNCSECEKSFAMRNLLSHHIIYEHNTLQLLKCPICYRRFNKVNGLSNHIRATHKIIRHHICKLCHHSFSRHHYLVYHMRSVHKDLK